MKAGASCSLICGLKKVGMQDSTVCVNDDDTERVQTQTIHQRRATETQSHDGFKDPDVCRLLRCVIPLLKNLYQPARIGYFSGRIK